MLWTPGPVSYTHLYDTENALLFINLYPGAERLANISACGRPGVDEYGYTAIDAAGALDTTKGLFFLGDKVAEPDMREIYRQVLFAIPHWMTMPPVSYTHLDVYKRQLMK